jgi:hypothetical protein
MRLIHNLRLRIGVYLVLAVLLRLVIRRQVHRFMAFQYLPTVGTLIPVGSFILNLVIS